MHSSIKVSYISVLILLFILLFSNITLAQGKQLDIVITNLSNEEINEIYEGESFKVSVLDPESEEPTPFLTDVDIEFNGKLYRINETRELILQAPDVDQDSSLIITASKEGYNSTNETITILDNESQDEPLKLIVTPEAYTIEAGKQFSILVKDENGNTISGAMVAIQSFGDTRITDDDGRAWLTAPEDKESITIIAEKDGYVKDTISIKVNIEPPWWIAFINSPYFPIAIAIVFLVLAIVFVSHRQKKSIYSRSKEISNDKTIKKYESDKKIASSQSDELEEKQYYSKDTVRVQPDEDSKVEEIRISRPRKEKEIVPVESEEDETEKVISRKKIQRRDYDWFEGTDDIRYEIDKLTGEIDEEGIDKWYEGVDNLKEKIDEKVKKKDKKKKEENEE